MTDLIILHKTQEGVEIPLFKMTNSHLIATINQKIKQMKTMYEIVNGDFKNDINAIANGYDVNNGKKRAKQTIQMINSKLPFYIYEAQIRGIDYSKDLGELFGRKEEISSMMDLLDTLF